VQLGRELDDHAAAIVGVPDPSRVPRPLQAVDQRRDRSARKVHRAGELTGGQRAPLVEDVEAAEIGPVEAHRRRDLFVEGLGRVLGRPDRECEPLQ